MKMFHFSILSTPSLRKTWRVHSMFKNVPAPLQIVLENCRSLYFKVNFQNVSLIWSVKPVNNQLFANIKGLLLPGCLLPSRRFLQNWVFVYVKSLKIPNTCNTWKSLISAASIGADFTKFWFWKQIKICQIVKNIDFE